MRGWRRGGGGGGEGEGEVVVWLLAMEVEIQDFSGRWRGGEVRGLAWESEGSMSGSFACSLEPGKQDRMAYRQALATEWMTESW